MTSLWRITTGADANANLLEIDLLRWFPSGEFGGWSADTRIEAPGRSLGSKNPSCEWLSARFLYHRNLTESTYFMSF